MTPFQKMRHRVAHTGYKPTLDEAREAHKVCCEAVRWFSGVGGMTVKPMLPDAKVTFPGISTGRTALCPSPPASKILANWQTQFFFGRNLPLHLSLWR